MPTIHLAIDVDAPQSRCFDLARCVEFHTRSMSRSGERAVAGVTNGLLSLNDQVTWEARHFGIRQRLTSRSTAGETTAFQYDPVGQLTRLTQPDGSHIAYTYDGARRLTEVADKLGNRIVYTLDAAGNRTKEDILDPQGALAKTLTRAYDALGRMQTLTGVVN